ncbi:bestrophin family protein [Emticicia sp. BO119]|uniref:bestrophin family protein n=1 Tax=Emticicia sp. BO119 TaxID=2757768 RepID=UPI0015F0D757|nr:bestrophin family ion channel [Emticicia sp. BO119]MBA4850087.1 multidrug transporter [Emticicia sp. BO119]
MNVGRIYPLKEFLYWTRREIYTIAAITIISTIIYEYLGQKWIAIPWVPIALVGTAAAFIVGFKNTQTYNRSWEARQIWGAIVNSSRGWGILVKDFVKNDSTENIHQQLLYRHISWLTALRYQLRESRNWENTNKVYNREYARYFVIPEKVNNMEDELNKLLSQEECAYVLSKKNRATHIISLQSKHLRELKEKGLIEPLNYIELENMLVNLYEQQGKCERIKNFPYPRQFASINLFFVRLFMILVPFGMLREFEKLGEHLVWLTIPFGIVVSWVFMAMEKVGESTENPFEGGANDIPITSMSRTIEIDLREMLDEKELPLPVQPIHNILM